MLLRAICETLPNVLRSVVDWCLGDVAYLDGAIQHYVRFFGNESVLLTPSELCHIFTSIVSCLDSNPFCSGNRLRNGSRPVAHEPEFRKDFGWDCMRRNVLYLRAGYDGAVSEIILLLLDAVGAFVDSTSGTLCLTDNATVREAGRASAAVIDVDSSIDVKLRNWISRAALTSIPVASEGDAMSASSLIALGCKVGHIINCATRSRSEMDAFVSSVDECVGDDRALALELLLLKSEQQTSLIGAGYREWVARVLPVVHLDDIIEQLIVPVGDSAVSIDAAGQALGSLSNACRNNGALAMAVARSLERLSDGIHSCFDVKFESRPVAKLCHGSSLRLYGNNVRSSGRHSHDCDRGA
jgi:hypothetical protein